MQHAVPQNISTYQFRLIGDMTVKQFMQLAAGIGLAILIYSTNLFGPIKITLAIISLIGGVTIAFVPLEERPLDKWLVAFIQAIYRPTEFLWKKNNPEPTFFSYKPHSSVIDPKEAEELMLAAAKRKQEGLSSFLQTLPQHQVSTRVQLREDDRLNSITQLLQTDDPNTLYPTTALQKMTANTPSNLQELNTPSTNLINIGTNSDPTINIASAPAFSEPQKAAETKIVDIPQSPSITIEKESNETAQGQILNQSESVDPQPQAENMSIQATTDSQAKTVPAITVNTLPFPSTPTTPNTIVGMVLTKDEKIIENAIIEIRDSAGVPVRATKTNKLGQFFSTTPLKNGSFKLEVEKEGKSFDILSLDLSGQIIKPLKITAKD